MHGTAQQIQDDEARRERLKRAIKSRPDALVGIRFVLDLQKLESPPPPVNSDDVARRARALARAEALSAAMPQGFPPAPPPPWKPWLDSADGADCRGGWVDGERVPKSKRAKHDDGDDATPKNRGGRKPLGERAMTAAEKRARHREKVAQAKQEQSCEFPLTVAAAKSAELSQFAIGDALLKEVGDPCIGDYHDGSYAKIDAARECLLKFGIDYSANTLRKLRSIAFTFPPSTRRQVSYCMHSEALTPANLDSCIATLPPGEKLTVDFVQDFVRALNGKTPKPRAPVPTSIAGLLDRLADALAKQSRAARIAAVHGLLDVLGIAVDDLSSNARQHLAARPAQRQPAAVAA
jgi:hypothetical protein